jgi:hypothetical protein
LLVCLLHPFPQFLLLEGTTGVSNLQTDIS